MLVVDASVLAPALADEGEDGDLFRQRIRGATIVGPDLLRLEVASVLRRQLAIGSLSGQQAANAVEDLLALPLVVYPTAPLLSRAWELRDNMTVYDGCYVALAEAIGCPIVTADRRMANAPGSRCEFEVL